jgi:hypothetical protein
MHNIIWLWNFISPLHTYHIHAAQRAVDAVWLERHDREWKAKMRAAELGVLVMVARRDPETFVGWTLGREEGERRRLAGILKVVNPGYYELNREVLGEGDIEELAKQVVREMIADEDTARD